MEKFFNEMFGGTLMSCQLVSGRTATVTSLVFCAVFNTALKAGVVYLAIRLCITAVSHGALF